MLEKINKADNHKFYFTSTLLSDGLSPKEYLSYHAENSKNPFRYGSRILSWNQHQSMRVAYVAKMTCVNYWCPLTKIYKKIYTNQLQFLDQSIFSSAFEETTYYYPETIISCRHKHWVLYFNSWLLIYF